MNLLHKRQTGESAAPAALSYGELAVSKAGELYVGAEDGSVVDQGLPVRRNAKGLSNVSYDVKMLQLQQLAEDVKPPMLGGFIEAFRDTTYMAAVSHDVTVDVENHCCKFAGREESGEAPGGNKIYENTRIAAVPEEPLYAGEYVFAFPEWQTAKKLSALRFTSDYHTFLYPGVSVAVLTVYGGETASSCTTQLGVYELTTDTTVKTLTGNWETAFTPYPYYRLTLTYQDAMEDGRMELSHGVSNGTFVSATGYGRVEYGYTVPTYAPKDGAYVTKGRQLGTPVTGGELYLHYETLPTGAALTPEIKYKDAFLPLVAGEERKVSLGGKMVYERRYQLPVQAETTKVIMVQINGTREKAADVITLYDIVVAMW